jgi:hypothetical protein
MKMSRKITNITNVSVLYDFFFKLEAAHYNGKPDLYDHKYKPKTQKDMWDGECERIIKELVYNTNIFEAGGVVCYIPIDFDEHGPFYWHWFLKYDDAYFDGGTYTIFGKKHLSDIPFFKKYAPQMSDYMLEDNMKTADNIEDFEKLMKWTRILESPEKYHAGMENEDYK